MNADLTDFFSFTNLGALGKINTAEKCLFGPHLAIRNDC